MIYRTSSYSAILNVPYPNFKVTPLFDAEYLRNGTRYTHSFNGILIHMPYSTLSFRITSSDLTKYSMTRRVARSLLFSHDLWIRKAFHFYRASIARTMPWKNVCSSVCPSHAGIVCKRLYISSKTGASNARRYEKKSRFSTSMLYLGNDARYSRSYYGRRIGNRTQAFE